MSTVDLETSAEDFSISGSRLSKIFFAAFWSYDVVNGFVRVAVLAKISSLIIGEALFSTIRRSF